MEQYKPRILYLTSFYPSEKAPHHGIFFRDHAEALATLYQVAVLTPEVPSVSQVKRLRSRVHSSSIQNVYTVRVASPVLSHRSRALIRLQEKRAFLKGMAEVEAHFGKPDSIIIQCSLPLGGMVQRYAEEQNIKYGVIEHFSFLPTMFENQWEEMKPVYEGASWIAGVSPQVVRVLKEAQKKYDFSSPILSIPNVLGTEFHGYVDTPPISSPFKWLYVGYEDVKKGYDLLPSIFYHLEESKQHWSATIVGDGHFEDLKNASFSTKLTFISSASRSEMVELMRKHHALLSCSRIETFGMAIVEMLASGRPVVTSLSGGPNSYMRPAFGITVAVDQPKETAKAMLRVMKSYGTYDSSYIHSQIISTFGAANYVKALEPYLV